MSVGAEPVPTDGKTFMKKLFTALTAIILLLTATSCGGRNGFAPQEITERPRKAPLTSFVEAVPPDDMSAISVSALATHAYTDPTPDMLGGADMTEYFLTMAINESESCRLSIYSETALDGVRLVPFFNGDETVKSNIFILDTSLGDALVPYDGTELSLPEKTVTSFILEFTSGALNIPGDYQYALRLLDKEEKVLTQFVITVRIFDIRIPDKRSFQTSLIAGREEVSSLLGGECSEEEYLAYYELLIKHGLSPSELPYDILDPRVDEYLSRHSVTSFRLPAEADGELLLSYYKKLRPYSKWLSKAYFMPMYEPDSIEDIAAFNEGSRSLQLLYPGVKITSPISKDIELSNGWDQINEMTGYSTLWCPRLAMWDGLAYEGHTYEHSLTFKDRMLKMQYDRGYPVWTYLGSEKTAGYAELSLGCELLPVRTLVWQLYMRGIGGFLHMPEGDGGTKDLLVYAGDDGFYASLRLKMLRDTFEDYELLLLVSQNLGSAYLSEKATAFDGRLSDISVSDEAFYTLRNELSATLEEKMIG